MAVCQGLHCCLFFSVYLNALWSCSGYVSREPRWICVRQECGTEVGLCTSSSSSLPLVFSQLEGDTITLKPRPSADLTNSSAPSPSHKVQRSVSANPKQRRFSDQGEYFREWQVWGTALSGGFWGLRVAQPSLSPVQPLLACPWAGHCSTLPSPCETGLLATGRKHEAHGGCSVCRPRPYAFPPSLWPSSWPCHPHFQFLL